MISILLSRLVLLVFGTLYPAYASYKTVKTKNVKDYVKWMMYWVVFAMYKFIEIFADIFIAFWFPFYYELKIMFVLWLICPATRGSSYIFRKLINPHLSKHEKVIDSYLNSLWDHGYDFIRKLGAQGMDYFIELLSEFLRKGHITALNLLPKVTEPVEEHNKETVQTEKTIEEKTAGADIFHDEEFDILTLENSELCEDMSSNLSVKDSEDSESESEEFKSVKSRPLKLRTRSQVKASTARGRGRGRSK
ncbi:receptor expression-enhancing protein 1-like [Uloborus diversus]|uniref:receptor expression-enhancing protein 1-like n=1 Tax=Uloborus diversus TaxID=327109 RepID=UPI00240A3826|nr:receptor expression-enhancing protein 1-like [Uloborus diversus]